MGDRLSDHILSNRILSNRIQKSALERISKESEIMIGILTFHKSVNYGSVLQAWALQRMLALKGIESEIIDYEPEKYGELYDVFLKPGRPHFLVKNINRVPVMAILAGQKKSFERFRRDNLKLSTESYTSANQEEISRKDYEAIICGSDQIWNTGASDADTVYFLPFDIPGRKAAYAVSLNTGSFDSGVRGELYKRWISDYDYLSCREQNGVDKLRSLLGDDRQVDLNLDPTLLHNRVEYARITSPKLIRGKYIFVYYVWFDSSIVNAARMISRRTGLPAYTIEMAKGGRAYLRLIKNGIRPVTRTLAPGDYLSLIKNAAYVVTDSFHGTAFSLIFEKQFVCINDGDETRGYKDDVRIKGILGRLGLQDRYITSGEAESFDLDRPVNFKKVTKKRLELAEESIGRLLGALGKET